MADTQTSDAVKRQLAQLEADLNKQIAVQNTFGNTGAGAIDTAYNELGGKLQTNLGDIKGTVDTGRTNITGDYNQATNQISDAESTLRSLLGDQVDLGPGGFNSPLQEIQRLTAENASSKANSLGSFEKLGTGNIAAAQQAIADAARLGTQQKGDLQSQIAAQIADLHNNYLNQRSDMETQLAQVLAEERYREEQMALEREKMAQAARQSALDRASRASGSGGYGKGRSGLMKWAAENGISKKELDVILSSINVGSSSGKIQDAYAYANAKVSQAGKPAGQQDILYEKGKAPRPKGVLAPPPNLGTISNGLDVYYGRY